MKLKTKLSGTEHEISLALSNSAAIVDVDGRHYEVEVRELTGGRYLLIVGSNVYKCRVNTKRDSRNSFEVVIRGNAYDITVVDPKRLRSAQSAGAHDHGVAEIVSPMPGKIVRILVEAGARVEAGAGIVVVEAMKMQNEMKAPKAGVVVSIVAEAGATVNAGDVLAVIE
jgi:biotin carboxyl carrier protein